MNTDWIDLIQRHIAGLTTDEEARRLNTALKTDDALADLYVRHVELEVSLEAKAASAEATRELLTATPSTRPTFWLSWRPQLLTAAAAGVIFGLFSASIVWAISSPRWAMTISAITSLENAGFEQSLGRLPEHFPNQAGVWCGDAAEVIESQAGLPSPAQGRRMLRFVRADRVEKGSGHPAYSCDVFQIVNLAEVKHQVEKGQESSIELSVSFQDLRQPDGALYNVACSLMLYEQAPAAISGSWPAGRMDADAFSSARLRSPVHGSVDGWSRITARCILPESAKYALIWISAHQRTASGKEMAPVYADDISLIIKTHTPIPLKIAQD